MIRFSFLFLCTGILAAQPFSIGVKAGARVTSDLDSYWATSESRRYTVGPMVTAKLPLGFRLEFDALYRRMGYRTAATDILGGSYFERDRANSWEFPIVVRRTLWHGIYTGIGYVPRVINGSSHVDSISVTSINPVTKTYSEYNTPGLWNTTHGIVGAAGIEKRLGPLHLAPEVRYVHWNQSALDVFGSRGFSIQSKQDQLDLLIGITLP